MWRYKACRSELLKNTAGVEAKERTAEAAATRSATATRATHSSKLPTNLVFEAQPQYQVQYPHPVPRHGNRFMGYYAQMDQQFQRNSWPENAPRPPRFQNFHVRTHCELRGALLDCITDDTIIDSGTSECIVNVWFKGF